METIQMPISWWVNKQNVVYTQNGILFGHKKSNDICYNMDDHWKHGKWKKPDIKDHILYDSTYIKMSRIGKSVETECRWVVA